MARKLTKEEHKAILHGEKTLKDYNCSISDEEMAMASGGVSDGSLEPKFSVGERVRLPEDPYIDDAYVTSMHYDGEHWIYKLRVHDIEEGWYDNYSCWELFMAKY